MSKLNHTLTLLTIAIAAVGLWFNFPITMVGLLLLCCMIASTGAIYESLTKKKHRRNEKS